LEWASGAEITTLNMHLNNGIYFTLPDKKVWINEQYESEFIKSLCDSYFHLYNQAKPLGVRLCIENTRNFHLPFIGRALEALRGFDGFYLTWDAGHDAMADYQEEPILMQHADRIRHMHLHDFNGQSDHQTLYTGKVPINDRLQFAADNQISVVIEVKTSDCLEQSVRHIRNRFVFPNG
jgi:sugar phosphate isomerase/epimerase